MSPSNDSGLAAQMVAALTSQRDLPCGRRPWHYSGHFRRISLCVLCLFVIIEGVIAIFFRENDFLWHVLRGHEFLAGDAYEIRADWYPLARLALDGLLAALPYRLARAAVYVAAVCGAVWSLVLWNRMDQPRLSMSRSAAYAATIVAVAMAFTLVQRDLDECGLQLVLLTLVTLAAYSIWRGRDMAGGLWLAAAISYKTTPILFVPLLLWKRRWKAAAWAMTFTIALNLSPAVWVGMPGTLDFNLRCAGRILLSSDANDPSYNHIEEPKPQNQAIAAALARYLQTHGRLHPLFIEHTAFVQFAALDGPTAGLIVKLLLLAAAAALAWRMRSPWTDDHARQTLPGECAAVCVLVALVSPLCWKQHLVMMLPCLVLLAREAIAGRAPRRASIAWLCVIGALLLVSGRGLWGRELSIVVISYKPYTMAAILAIVRTLALARITHEPSTASSEVVLWPRHAARSVLDVLTNTPAGGPLAFLATKRLRSTRYDVHE